MSWEAEACPKCGVTNWIDTGDPQDMTGHDVSAAKCYACGHAWWLYDDADDYTDGTAEEASDTGKSCPDFGVESIHADRLYQVQVRIGVEWHDVESVTKNEEETERTLKHLGDKFPRGIRVVTYEAKGDL